MCSQKLLEEYGLSKEQVEKMAFQPQKGGCFLLGDHFSCWWSPELTEYLSVDASENPDFSIYFLKVYPDDLPLFQTQLHSLWKEGNCRIEHRLWKDNQLVSVVFSAVRFSHPQKGWFAVGSVTERNLSQDFTPLDGTISLETGRLVSFSPYLAQYFGVDVEQLSHIPLIDFISKENRQIFQEWLRQVPVHLFPSHGVFQREKGGLLCLTAFSGTVPDLLKLTFWRNASSHGQFHSEFMKSKLKEELCGEILNDFSNEIQTPVQIMSSALQLIDSQLSEIPSQTLQNTFRQYLSYLHGNLNRLLHITGNVQQAANIGTGNLLVQFSPCEFLEMARSVVECAKPFAQETGVMLEFENFTGMEHLTLCCDSSCVERMLMNLLSNGVKHTPFGGAVRVKIYADQQVVKILVEDTGVGMTEEQMAAALGEYVFSPDHFIPRSGWGMGLCIVRSLAALHDGSLEGKSIEGKGSIFTLTLSRQLSPSSSPIIRQVLEESDLERSYRAKIAFSSVTAPQFPPIPKGKNEKSGK